MNKMKFKAIHVNNLDDDTIKEIRIWRNKPFVRRNMFTQHEISEEEHNKYIESIKNNKTKGLFVFYLDDKPFGVYQYSIDIDDSSVYNGNYLIDEEFQQLGYGAIQTYFINIIITKYLNVKKTKAEILDINTRALKLAKENEKALIECLDEKMDINGTLHDIYKVECVIDNDFSLSKRVEKAVHYLVDDEYKIIY